LNTEENGGRELLDFNRLSELLDGSDEEFASFKDESDGELAGFRRVLSVLPKVSPGVLKLEDAEGRTGARPLEPVGDAFFVPYRQEWDDRDGCLRWMDGVLKEHKVAAVDGGQIYPERSSGVPVAVLQAGVAVNDHGGGLRTDERLSVIGPRQFLESIFQDMPFNSLVDAKRFELECEAAATLMDDGGDEHPVTVLMDYPLLVPHLLGYQDRLRYTYLHAVKRLLAASERTGNPAVGFVDLSVARDLTWFLYHVHQAAGADTPLPKPRWTYDGNLLRNAAAWGTRTRAMLLDRDDSRGEGGTTSLDLYEEMGDRLAFFYLCTDGVSFSRVEIPRFVYDRGMLGQVVDVLLAQTALRGNYPDILHQSHKAASITRGESEMFTRMFDRFCAHKGLARERSSKEMHKRYGGIAGKGGRPL
jgi:hypothetical protein